MNSLSISKVDTSLNATANGLSNHLSSTLNFSLKPMIPSSGTTARDVPNGSQSITSNGINHHIISQLTNSSRNNSSGSLSPNLPSIVKVEPRLPSPCLNSPNGNNEGSSVVTNGGSMYLNANNGSSGASLSAGVNKRLRIDDTSPWVVPPSPGQLSIGSLSPPPLMNGHLSNMGHTNLSPTSSYDSFSPRGKVALAIAMRQAIRSMHIVPQIYFTTTFILLLFSAFLIYAFPSVVQSVRNFNSDSSLSFTLHGVSNLSEARKSDI
ncbi:ecdysone receptor A-like isoform [Dinothrombium tinctorium]|uniref:Ecdysone receptor A-like isoform n=1 Tax=Dinothrombium tinctorium TaxID=1965070 RepID=A0A3S3PB51_9ACAR|nr:ecdysone receptor A-like isoform [Dinothrombium tinctorium]RWS16009.1 ecdysone receptor A-like isoform [Dinothrombium tinctorium]